MDKMNLMSGASVQEGATIFKCPNCAEYEIVRSKHAKETGIGYRCPKCEFEGP